MLPGPHNNRCLTCNLPPTRRSKSSPALAEQAAARLAPRVRLVADFDSAELAGLMPQPSSAAGAARLRQQQQAQQARWFDEQTGLRMRATLVSLSACLHVACLSACLPAASPGALACGPRCWLSSLLPSRQCWWERIFHPPPDPPHPALLAPAACRARPPSCGTWRAAASGPLRWQRWQRKI